MRRSSEVAPLTIEDLADRVAKLEAIVQKLQSPRNSEGRIKDWRRTIGMHAGDDAMCEIFELGRQLREADRGNLDEQATE